MLFYYNRKQENKPIIDPMNHKFYSFNLAACALQDLQVILVHRHFRLTSYTLPTETDPH